MAIAADEGTRSPASAGDLIRMRILVLNEAPGGLLGGIMTETRMLVDGLVSRGHEVALASETPLPGLECLHFHIDYPRGRASLEQFEASLDRFRPDLVHVMFCFVSGLLAYSRLLKQRPWISTCHSTPPRECSAGILHHPDWLHYIVRLWRIRRAALGGLMVYGLRLPPRIIVHSETIRKDLTKRFYPTSRIDVIPFGYVPSIESNQVETRGRPPAGGPLRILTVAGITHSKGHHDFLAALPVIKRKYPDVTYTIVGEVRDSGYLEFLKQRVVSLDLVDNVLFTCYASKQQVDEALSSADVFVQPSHEEGFCLSYLEAAGHVPRLVGSQTGALAEISADDPGARVVPVRDAKALAHAVLELLQVDLPSRHMQDRRERLARQFSWLRYLDLHEAIYFEETSRSPARDITPALVYRDTTGAI